MKKDNKRKNELNRLKNYDPKSGHYSHTSSENSSMHLNNQQDDNKPKKTMQVEVNTVSHSKDKRETQDALQIKKLRRHNAQKKAQAAAAKRERAAQLAQLSRQDKRAFLAQEQADKQEQTQRLKAEKRAQKAAYHAMPPAEKKAFRKQQRHQKRLEKRAKKGYVAKQIVKYALLAALTAGLVYVGYVAYGALIDNSAAFSNTDQALATPPKPTEQKVPAEQTPSPTIKPDDPTPSPTVDPYELLLSQADLDFMKERVNILVLGIDESIERSNWGSFRTDTIILVSIDFETKDVFMLSLPRDSFVMIYNTGEYNRINTAFSKGGGKDGNGFQNAMDTVSMVLGGVPVNHYVCFDMNVVKEVVNAIGGLDYDVDIKVNMCGRTIDPGLQYMDGQMVLDYCRQRKGSSDVARADRQQRMIFAIFDAIKQSGQMKDIPDIYSAITGNIYTDLSFAQIVSLASFGMGINTDNLERYMLPGGFLNIDQTSLWGINQYQKRDLVEKLFEGTRIKVNELEHLTYLRDLAQQKRNAVAGAEAAASGAEAYVNIPENMAVITPEELNEFNTKTAALRAVAAVRAPFDVEPTIQPILDETTAYNTWVGVFKATIETRKMVPTPSPPPDPTETPSPTDPGPTETPNPTE